MKTDPVIIEEQLMSIRQIHSIEYETACMDSDGKPVNGTERKRCILYNTSVISDEEAKNLVLYGMPEHDVRVICTDVAQAELLFNGIQKTAALDIDCSEELATEEERG